jgi:uncharacterized membrane protein (TIGR02234 family)
MAEPRRTFGPVVLLGLASAGLMALAGSRAWVEADIPDDAGVGAAYSTTPGIGEMPLAGAVSLVVLAAWGVLLVTRGRIRRAVAVLGLLGSVGVLVAVVAGWSQVPESVRAEYASYGVTVGTDPTAWYVVALVTAVSSVALTVLAVRWCPAWPEMGSRYDAPGAAAADEPAEPAEDRSNLDLWKAMDEGRDPTE